MLFSADNKDLKLSGDYPHLEGKFLREVGLIRGASLGESTVSVMSRGGFYVLPVSEAMLSHARQAGIESVCKILHNISNNCKV